MESAIKAIPTKYKGVQFRSKLEARYAEAFDANGIRWCYEVEGYDLDGVWYLPDFWLPDMKVFIEVKGPNVPGVEKPLLLSQKLRDVGSENSVMVGDASGFLTSPRENLCPIYLFTNGSVTLCEITSISGQVNKKCVLRITWQNGDEFTEGPRYNHLCEDLWFGRYDRSALTPCPHCGKDILSMGLCEWISLFDLRRTNWRSFAFPDQKHGPNPGQT